MKYVKFVLLFLLSFTAINSFIYSNCNTCNKGTKEQAVVLSSNEVNDFLDVKIKTELLTQGDSLKNPLKIEVKIFNQKGTLVFSATKNVSQFSIFTGGLPEGNYTISCKFLDQQLQKNFSVKH